MYSRRCFSIVSIILLCAGSACSTTTTEWPQWGGPNRNFMVASTGLADSWPQDGPPRLWKRELGDGFSTIVTDSSRLYTMYRTEKEEFVVALDAATGETIWEHKTPSPFTELMAAYGPGPHSTPLLVGHRLFTIGTNMMMTCLDKSSGKVIWQHDLVEEYGAEVPGRGYACSPLAYKNTVILPVGGKEGQTFMAFRQDDGALVWKKQDFKLSYSSPIIITFEGEDQLVAFMGKGIVGLNPNNGDLLWTHTHETNYGANIATPLWTGDGLLFLSAAYNSGSRVLRLKKENGKTVPEELWYGRKMRIHHGNAIRIGDYVYGSSGDSGPALFAAVNIKTGEVAWRKRGFAKATCVYADGKTILLDEDGQLALLTVTPEGMEVHSKCQVAERTSWAAPTLAGTTLYIRDRKNITALDLSR